MATFHVIKVKKEATIIRGTPHRHIIGVITNDGVEWTNEEVVTSIEVHQNDWCTSVPGQPMAKIRPFDSCPTTGCPHRPYLMTEADSTAENNLENLPEA